MHTPGPWTINEWPQGDAEVRIGAVGTPRIATVHIKYVSINEQRANARIIAAAPELYEALKIAVLYMPLDNSPGTQRHVVEQVIAKAEGKE